MGKGPTPWQALPFRLGPKSRASGWGEKGDPHSKALGGLGSSTSVPRSRALWCRTDGGPKRGAQDSLRLKSSSLPPPPNPLWTVPTSVWDKPNRGDPCPRAGPLYVRGNVDHRDCDLRVLSRFTALFVEVGVEQSIVQRCAKFFFAASRNPPAAPEEPRGKKAGESFLTSLPCSLG